MCVVWQALAQLSAAEQFYGFLDISVDTYKLAYKAVLIATSATGPVLALLSCIIVRIYRTCRADARFMKHGRSQKMLPQWMMTFPWGFHADLVYSPYSNSMVQRGWRCASAEIHIDCCQNSQFLALSVLNMARPAGHRRSIR